MWRILLTITLAVAAYLFFSSFRNEAGHEVILHSKDIAPNAESPTLSNPKDINVLDYLKTIGVNVKVNVHELTRKYGEVDLEVDEARKVVLNFPNPEASNFQLDIYDMNGNPVITYLDIYDAQVAVDSNFLDNGTYIYKLAGNGNLYAGKFDY